MTQHNNPAGRLYDLLGRFRDTRNGSIALAWAHILDVSEPVVREQLSSVAELVTQIDAAVEHPERQAFVAHVKRYRSDWLEAIFPLQHSFSEPADVVKPGDPAYEALGTIAAHLGAVASEGEMPSEERHSELVEEVQALVEEVGADDDLPQEVAHLIIRRLAAVETALRHIEVGGPESVRLATEALIGATVANSSDRKVRDAKATMRLWAVAGALWLAFSSGPAVQASIEAWPKVVHELAPGQRTAPTTLHRAADVEAQTGTDHERSNTPS
jgi:hypothetical protein